MKEALTKHQRPLVDEKSFELAEHFLGEDTEDQKWELADVIQQAVEGWFQQREWLVEARKHFREARERLCTDADTWDFMIMRWGQQHPRICASNHPTGESINYGGRKQL